MISRLQCKQSVACYKQPVQISVLATKPSAPAAWAAAWYSAPSPKARSTTRGASGKLLFDPPRHFQAVQAWQGEIEQHRVRSKVGGLPQGVLARDRSLDDGEARMGGRQTPDAPRNMRLASAISQKNANHRHTMRAGKKGSRSVDKVQMSTRVRGALGPLYHRYYSCLRLFDNL